MSEYREIVEPEPVPLTPMEREIDRQVKVAEAHKRGDPPPPRRGQATIIRGPGKCKRLHLDWVWLLLGALAATGIVLNGIASLITVVTQ